MFGLSLWIACAPETPLPAMPPAAEPAAAPALAPPAGEVTWTAPAETSIPATPYGDSVRRGMDLFTRTPELLPDHVGANMTCSSCHLDKGRKPFAVPMVGAHGRYPKYMDRSGTTVVLQDRVNYCFTRSLAGSRIPTDSREMVDLVNYVAWLSNGVGVGDHLPAETLPPLLVDGKPLTGDPRNGEALYTAKGCVTCHQVDGGGVPGAFPAVWGPRSYSIGASMAREERAAAFIQRFMPQTAPGTLTPQEAYDLSAFVNGHPRPDSPAKEDDWPDGGAPVDVPYATKDHAPYRPPAELIPRSRPELAVVPVPASVTGVR